MSTTEEQKRVYTIGELAADLDQVIVRVHLTGPIAVTRYGRFMALISPLDDDEVMRAVLSRGPIAEEVARRIAEVEVAGEEGLLTTDEVLAEINKEKDR